MMNPISVLLVDNNLIFLRIVMRFLDAHDDVVVVGAVHNGEEVLTRVRELEPDVVLIDIAMPDLPGGLEFISRLRAALPGVGIIALALIGIGGYREATLEAGADDFIPKAAVGADLLPAIRRVGQASQPQGRVCTVLVVEDDGDIAQLIALQLRREGFEVLTTAYGGEAVSLAQTRDIDLITLDMMLPDITGMEVLHQLKVNPETADIPVIVVSVLLPEQTGGTEQGVAAHITKPFAFEKLMESIRQALEASQQKKRAPARTAIPVL